MLIFKTHYVTMLFDYDLQVQPDLEVMLWPLVTLGDPKIPSTWEVPHIVMIW